MERSQGTFHPELNKTMVTQHWKKSHSRLIIQSIINSPDLDSGQRKNIWIKRESESGIYLKERYEMSNEDTIIQDCSLDRVEKELCEDTMPGDKPPKDNDDKEELYIALKKGLEDIEDGRTRPFKEAIDDIKTRREHFSKEILKELIDEGYSGSELLDEFRIRQAKVRPAVEAIL